LATIILYVAHPIGAERETVASACLIVHSMLTTAADKMQTRVEKVREHRKDDTRPYVLASR
jgi:hypothetical protein